MEYLNNLSVTKSTVNQFDYVNGRRVCHRWCFRWVFFIINRSVLIIHPEWIIFTHAFPFSAFDRQICACTFIPLARVQFWFHFNNFTNISSPQSGNCLILFCRKLYLIQSLVFSFIRLWAKQARASRTQELCKAQTTIQYFLWNLIYLYFVNEHFGSCLWIIQNGQNHRETCF